jgi:hypothetical protein
VERYGRRVPPYRETRDYVKKVALNREEPAEEPSSGRVVYKTFELVDGRLVPRYSTKKPASGSYEIVNR